MLNKPVSNELTFSAIEKFSHIAVFNLQASDYVHCEEEEGTNLNVSLHIYTLVTVKKNNMTFFVRISKDFQNFIVHYNWTKRYVWTLIYLLNAMIYSNFRYF